MTLAVRQALPIANQFCCNGADIGIAYELHSFIVVVKINRSVSEGSVIKMLLSDGVFDEKICADIREWGSVCYNDSHVGAATLAVPTWKANFIFESSRGTSAFVTVTHHPETTVRFVLRHRYDLEGLIFLFKLLSPGSHFSTISISAVVCHLLDSQAASRMASASSSSVLESLSFVLSRSVFAEAS